MPGMGEGMPGMGGGMPGMPPGMGDIMSDPEMVAAMQNPKVMVSISMLSCNFLEEYNSHVLLIGFRLHCKA